MYDLKKTTSRIYMIKEKKFGTPLSFKGSLSFTGQRKEKLNSVQ
jgi:hypothetical protein